jgi:hypothetical protein
MIPIVSADVRRILNYDFDEYVTASFDTTAATIDMEMINTFISYPLYQPAGPRFPLGTVVYHPNITQDTYLQSYSPDTGLYTLSSTPSDEGNYVYIAVNIAQFPTISKMIWYRISMMDTDSASDKSVSSERYGPVSKNYADSEINKQYNYPQLLIDDLGVPFARV